MRPTRPGDLCAARRVADTTDRRPIQQVAEMSAPRTCSDRVQGCPAVAEIPVSARGGCGPFLRCDRRRPAASAASSSSDSHEIPKRHDHGRTGDGTHASGPPMNARPNPLLTTTRPPWSGFPGPALLTDLAAPAALRAAIPEPSQCPGIQRRSSTRQPRVEVIAWGCRWAHDQSRTGVWGPDAYQRRTSR